MGIPLNFISIMGIIIGIITGVIGTITGIISLIWHINNNKPKLKLKSAHFVKGGFGPLKPRGKEPIGVKITLRNLSNRSTTIEDLSVQINNCWKTPISFKPTKVSGDSSIQFEFTMMFFDDLKIMRREKIEKFGVCVVHTFGVINEVRKSDFSTGYFTID